VLLLIQGFTLLLAPFDLSWLVQAHERMAAPAVFSVLATALQTFAFVLFVHDPSHLYRYVLIPYPFRIASLGFSIWYANHLGLMPWRSLRLALAGTAALVKESVPMALAGVNRPALLELLGSYPGRHPRRCGRWLLHYRFQYRHHGHVCRPSSGYRFLSSPRSIRR